MGKSSPSIFERLANLLIYLKISRSDSNSSRQTNRVPSKTQRRSRRDEIAAQKAAKAEAKAAEAAQKAAEKAAEAALMAEMAAVKAGKKQEEDAAKKRAQAADKAVSAGVGKAKAAKPMKSVMAPELPQDDDRTPATFAFTVDNAEEKLREKKPDVSDFDILSEVNLEFASQLEGTPDDISGISSVRPEPEQPKPASVKADIAPRKSKKSSFTISSAEPEQPASEKPKDQPKDQPKNEQPESTMQALFASSGRSKKDQREEKPAQSPASSQQDKKPEKKEPAAEKKDAPRQVDTDKPYIYIPSAEAAERASRKVQAAREKNAIHLSRGAIAAIIAAAALLLLLGAYTAYFGPAYRDADAYINMIGRAEKLGDKYSAMAADDQADYFYALSGSAATSMRAAVDACLDLPASGSDVSPSDGRVGDWDIIGAISSVTPYPSYFEGLVYQQQGDFENAARCFVSSRECDYDIADFSFLRRMPEKRLRDLRARLVSLEDGIYSKYTPALLSADGDELTRARFALSQDPFDSGRYYDCAIAALKCGDAKTAADMVNIGLLVKGSSIDLHRLGDIMNERFAPTASASDAAVVSVSDALAPVRGIDYSRIHSSKQLSSRPVSLELYGVSFGGTLTGDVIIPPAQINAIITAAMASRAVTPERIEALSRETYRVSVPAGATNEDCAAILAALPQSDVSPSDVPAEPEIPSGSDISGGDIAADPVTEEMYRLQAQAVTLRQPQSFFGGALKYIKHAFSFDYWKIGGSWRQYLRDKENTDLKASFAGKQVIDSLYDDINSRTGEVIGSSDSSVNTITISDTVNTHVRFYGNDIPVKWTADAVLIQQNGSAHSIAGSYTGSLSATAAYDMTGFDKNFANTFKTMNPFAAIWKDASAAGMTLTDTTVSPSVVARVISCSGAAAEVSDNGASSIAITDPADTRTVSISHIARVHWNRPPAPELAWNVPVSASGAKLSFENHMYTAVANGYTGFAGVDSTRYDIGWDASIWGAADMNAKIIIH